MAQLSFPMQKTKLVNLLSLVGELPGYKDVPSIAQNIEAIGTLRENSFSFYNFQFVGYEEIKSDGKSRVKSLFYKDSDLKAFDDVWLRGPVTDSRTLFCNFTKSDSTPRLEVRN